MNFSDTQKNIIIHIILIFGAAFLFIPFLGQVHLFDWDEINFAEAAREMIVSKDYLTVQINFQPFWEKPPLFIWMQVLSMKMFGVNEFAARFPNAICGIVVTILLYNIGKQYKNKTFGLLWVMAYLGSALPFLYFKSGIIDPWFNTFIFIGTVYLIRFLQSKNPSKRYLFVALSGAFIGLSILTKGPVGLLIYLMCFFLYVFSVRFHIRIHLYHILLCALSCAFTGGFWFILQILQGNIDIVMDFIDYQIRLFITQDAGHGGFPLFHVVILFSGVFPASIFALQKIVGFRSFLLTKNKEITFERFMFILFWVVLFLFSIVKTKIVHYSSLCYFPLTFFAALELYRLVSTKQKLHKYQKILLLIISALICIGFIGFFILTKNVQPFIDSGIITDLFVLDYLKADIVWHNTDFIAGLFPLLFVLIALISFRHEIKKQVILIFLGGLLFMVFSLAFIIKNIEGYSQRAALEFYETVQTEDCVIKPLGFKSYAHLFYGKAKKHRIPLSELQEEWLATKEIKKPVYFVCKIHREQRFIEKYPKLTKLYSKNGFVFFKREP